MFNEEIAKARKEKGLSQIKLAAMIGVTVQAVQFWEYGWTCPSVQHIIKLSLIFEKSIDDLLWEERRIAVERHD